MRVPPPFSAVLFLVASCGAKELAAPTTIARPIDHAAGSSGQASAPTAGHGTAGNAGASGKGGGSGAGGGPGGGSGGTGAAAGSGGAAVGGGTGGGSSGSGGGGGVGVGCDDPGLQAGAPWPRHRRCNDGGNLGRVVGPKKAGAPVAVYVPIGGKPGGPVIDKFGAVYVQSIRDIACVAAQKVKWTQRLAPPGTPMESPFPYPAGATPTVAADGSIVAVSDLGVFKLSPTGDLLSYYQPPGPCTPVGDPAFPLCGYGFGTSPAIGADGTIYVARPGIELLALTPTSTVKWSLKGASVPSTAVAIDADGVLYGGTSSGHVVAISPDGKPLFDTKVSTLAVTDVLVSGSTITAIAASVVSGFVPMGPGAVAGLSKQGELLYSRQMPLVGVAAMPFDAVQTLPPPMTTWGDGFVVALSPGALPPSVVLGNAAGLVASELIVGGPNLVGPLVDAGGAVYWGESDGIHRSEVSGSLGTSDTLPGPPAFDAAGRLVFAAGSVIHFIAP